MNSQDLKKEYLTFRNNGGRFMTDVEFMVNYRKRELEWLIKNLQSLKRPDLDFPPEDMTMTDLRMYGYNQALYDFINLIEQMK